MAQATRYAEQPLFSRIVNVGWAGGIVVLEVEGPDGLTLEFPGQFVIPHSMSPFRRQDLRTAIIQIDFPGSDVIGNYYDEVEPWYSIESVVFPDSPIFFPPHPSYDFYKSLYVPPEGRFEEVIDLRTLGTNVTHAATIASTGFGGWPLNGEWATWGIDAPNPPDAAGWYGRFTDGRPGNLPPSSGPDPNAPGYTIEPFWGFGEVLIEREFKRDRVRGIWLLNFAPPHQLGGFPVETLTGQTVDVLVPNLGHDERLGSATITIRLKVYSANVTFTIAETSLTATSGGNPVPPSKTQTMSVPYDQDTTFKVDARGFVS